MLQVSVLFVVQIFMYLCALFKLTEYGQKLYTITIPVSVDNIIFSDSNGTQTVDIPFDGTATRYYTTTISNGKYKVATW